MFLFSLRFPVVLALGTFALPAAAQSAAVQAKLHKPEPPKPYTAEYKITTVQTLPNNITITRESSETDALDSTGRRLTSTTELTPQLWAVPHTSGRVFSRETQANWDSHSKKAFITQQPPKDQQHGCWADEMGRTRMEWPDPANPRPHAAVQPPGVQPKHTSEDLGKTTIQGIEAVGVRNIQTIAAGEIGNDQPILTTFETWQATSGTHVLLRSIQVEPMISTTTTREIVTFTEGEPDPALFQPPDGYEVKNIELHQVPCA